MTPFSPVIPRRRQRLSIWQKGPLVAEILTQYARVRWLLRNEDAVAAMVRLRGRQVPESPMDERDAWALGYRLAQAVIRTLTPVPADSRCLFRSLVLTTLLERREIDSSLIVAVRPEPFAAHAWVEYRGRPLLPPADAGFERLTEL